MKKHSSRLTSHFTACLKGVSKMASNKQEDNLEYSYPIRRSTFILAANIAFSQLLVVSVSFLFTFLLTGTEKMMKLELSSSAFYISFIFILQIINVILLSSIFLKWIRTTWIIRPNEVIEQKGVWSMREDFYSTSVIEEVMVEQSFLGKVFNYGTLRVCNPLLPQNFLLEDIPNPHAYAHVIRNSEKKEKLVFLPRRTFSMRAGL